MKLLIRPATQQDFSVLHRFISELEEKPLDPVTFRAIYLRNLSDPRIHYLVAESDGQVVGFVSCHVQYLLHHVGKVGEIQELFVKPEFRNQQVGRQLVEAVEALARQERWVNLEVTTNQRRNDTHRFYQNLTFKQSHYKFVKPLQKAD